MKKKHILIIPSWYPSFRGDIGGSFFREQAIALNKAGHQVGVIVPIVRSLKDIKGLITKPYGIKFEDDFGVRTFRNFSINFTVKMPFLARKNWVRQGVRLFDTYVKKYGFPDVIHVHSLINGGFLAEYLGRKYNIPYVVTEHSSIFARGLTNKSLNNELLSVVHNSSFNIAVSKEFQQLLTEKFSDSNWSYIPNIVNDSFLSFPIEQTQSQKIVFINICFLKQNKRVDLLLEAFAKSFAGRQNILLKIGGDGEEKERLLSLASELKIDDQIIFLGELSREEVKREISSADAFVLSSEYETFGVVLVEALALGKPVIATKCGGPESIVVPEVGYLVEKNSVLALSDALNKYIEERERFSAEQIRTYCKNNFSEMAVVEQLNEVYDEVLKLNNEV